MKNTKSTVATKASAKVQGPRTTSNIEAKKAATAKTPEQRLADSKRDEQVEANKKNGNGSGQKADAPKTTKPATEAERIAAIRKSISEGPNGGWKRTNAGAGILKGKDGKVYDVTERPADKVAEGEKGRWAAMLDGKPVATGENRTKVIAQFT